MNILIVDDQRKVVEATKKLVDWKKLMVDKVFTANSAATAKDILKKEQIDIMLTDIEMPGEDGIALQRWQAKEYPEVICIFLTSHADFDYAKEAIRNGAFDYILQPVSLPEIEETIGRCISHLEERKLLDKKREGYNKGLWNTLETHVFTMFHHKEHFIDMKRWRQDSETEDTDWWYLPCLLEVSHKESKLVKEILDEVLGDFAGCQEKIFFVSASLDVDHIGMLFYAKEKKPERVDIKEKLNFLLVKIKEEINCELNFYIGKYAKDNLPIQIEAIYKFQLEKILKKNLVYLVEESENTELHKPSGGVWSRWLIRGDTLLVKNQITNLLKHAQEERLLTIAYMQKIIHAFLEACSIACYEQNRKLPELFPDSDSYKQMLHAYSSVEELCHMVDFCLKQYELMLPEKGDDEDRNSVQERIQEVIAYLDENMDRMISRREAAKYAFLNEDYMSRMFLKETGMRYKEYVLKHKMNYAGKLLENTDFPVAIIASKVGYDNFSNFTKMFRKIKGVTPTDYRKKKCNQYKSEK